MLATILALPLLLVPGAPLRYDLADYLPVTVGNRWSWQDTGAAQATHTAAIPRTAEVSGVPVLVREHSTRAIDYFRPGSRGLEWYGGVATARLGLLPWTLDQPIVLPKDIKVGEVRRQTLAGRMGPMRPLVPLAVPATLRFTLNLEGVEDVKCPAGEFEDCLRVSMTFDTGKILGYDTRTERTVWYARGVGEVRIIMTRPDAPTCTSLLKTATIRGRTIP